MTYNKLYLAIFSHHPEQWGLRGDPYLWTLLAHKLLSAEVPGDVRGVESAIAAAFEELTGRRLQEAVDFRVDGIPAEGMSGGMISGAAWRDRLVPLLVERAARYFERGR